MIELHFEHVKELNNFNVFRCAKRVVGYGSYQDDFFDIDEEKQCTECGQTYNRDRRYADYGLCGGDFCENNIDN